VVSDAVLLEADRGDAALGQRPERRASHGAEADDGDTGRCRDRHADSPPRTGASGVVADAGSRWTRSRKPFTRACTGASSTAAGDPSSITRPSPRNTMRSATSRANAISWLTATIVMPDRAR